MSVFATPEAWISLVTLIFLEIVLGVDNIVFIAITTDRLPASQQRLGRKLGLAGAMVMRCLFLCFASWLVHMTTPLLSIGGVPGMGRPFELTVRDLVLLVGGAYLLYKGVDELRSVLSLSSERAEAEDAGQKHSRLLSLPAAVGIIMVMDIVFSIDSVITAVGLANHLIVMILAVVIAVVAMMVFIDAISDFINEHVEMKILALFFIAAIGVLLVFDSLGIRSGVEVLDMGMEKLMVYFAMLFCLIIELFQMAYNKRRLAFVEELHQRDLAAALHAMGADPANAVDDDASDDEDEKRGIASRHP